MRRRNELLPKDLKDVCNPNLFKFETTKELIDTSDLVYGQERGIKALQFGTEIDIKGYNMYLEGPSGVGKTMYTKKFLDKKAEFIEVGIRKKYYNGCENAIIMTKRFTK